jgi:hypothetical protein
MADGWATVAAWAQPGGRAVPEFSPTRLAWAGPRMLVIEVPCNTVRRMAASARPYRPMSLARLGRLLAGADDALRWRLIAEFLEEYSWEPSPARWALLTEEPPGTGDERWDVFLAALAEHLAAQEDRAGPSWSESRSLRRLWFPFNTRAARADAIVRAPAAFRRRGVFVAAEELQVA